NIEFKLASFRLVFNPKLDIRKPQFENRMTTDWRAHNQLAVMHKPPHRRIAKWTCALLLLLLILAAGPAVSLRAGQSHHAGRFKPANLVVAANSPAPAAPPHAPRKTALDKRIDKILAPSDARRGSWGIQVVDLESG